VANAEDAGLDTYRSVTMREPGPSTPFSGLTMKMVEAVWSDPALSRRERRLVTIALVAAQCATRETEIHLRAAIASGDLSTDDLEALCGQVAMYAGWPAAASMHAMMRSFLDGL
jgi:4-carboxymuconolactone decarboxylase